jgi:hypothetical protein
MDRLTANLNNIFVSVNKEANYELEANLISVPRGLTVQRHIETSCTATAEMIRWVVSGGETPYRLHKFAYMSQNEAEMKRLYQVEFVDDYNVEHVLTILNIDKSECVIFQSYYAHETINKKVISRAILHAKLVNISAADPQFFDDLLPESVVRAKDFISNKVAFECRFLALVEDITLDELNLRVSEFINTIC